jgi:hypothetical protein
MSSNFEPTPPATGGIPPTVPPPPIPPPSTSGPEAGGVKEQGKEVAGAAAQQGKEVAGTAAQQGKEVASTAAAGAQQVAGEAAREIKDVARTATEEIRGLVGQVGGELQTQASTQTDRLAEGLRTLSGQLQKAGSGSPLEAGPVRDLASQAGKTFDQLSTRLSDGGVDGLVQDVSSFARRKPGLFLAGAAATGFLAGRMLRGAQAAAKDEQSSSTGSIGGMSRPSATMPAVSPPPLASPPVPPPAPRTDAVVIDGDPVELAPGVVPSNPIGGPR